MHLQIAALMALPAVGKSSTCRVKRSEGKHISVGVARHHQVQQQQQWPTATAEVTA